MKTVDYENIRKFGYYLFEQMAGDENPVISPVSAYLTLTVAGCGADGTTRDEFYNVLGKNMEMLSGGINNIFFKQDGDEKLFLSNSVWIDKQFMVNNEWADTVKHLAGAEIFQAELFRKETMDAINQWVCSKTNGMIDLLQTEPFDRQVMLALFDTIFFRGKWAYPFQMYKTKKEPFHLNSCQTALFLPQTKQVDMMNRNGSQLDYISNDFAEGIILPYHTNKEIRYDKTRPHDKNMQEGMDSCGILVFVAIKPRENISIREVCHRLDSKTMKKLMKSRRTKMIDLKLPKFEVVFDKMLNESLINMGLDECFDMENADFTSMGKSQRGEKLYVKLMRQKSKIIVNEQGTEAAAVSELLGAPRAVLKTKKLYFNEPFFYMIMDMNTEVPLFIGILDNPIS